jgi:hypothetical protein
MSWLYGAHFVFLAALVASVGWLLFLARVHDRE